MAAKKKVKICKNLQCTARVNKSDAAVCAGCGTSFRGVSWLFLTDEEIERKLTGEPEREQEDTPPLSPASPETVKAVICPSCRRYVQYSVGLEFCECGEYVQEEMPTDVLQELVGTIASEELPPEEEIKDAKAMTSLDGLYRLEFTGDFMKIGREKTGSEYFEKAGKGKVSREHAILKIIDGAWHLSYCKKEDRNYTDGVENPIFINGRRMERTENYRLQVGDEIAFSELDKTDPLAAFFKVE